MKYGLIRLMSGEREVARERYQSVGDRQSIITRWQIEYKEYDFYSLQIYPIPYERVSKTSKKPNFDKVIIKSYSLKSDTHLIRPAAVYNNIPTYKYGD